MPEALSVASSGGVSLEAELHAVDAPRAAVVLCHPHPRYGGTMRSIVIGALFAALPGAGVSALRFNFRGVGASTGAFDEGLGETDDARAVLDALAAHTPSAVPLVMAGWSFGGDVALSVDDPRLAAWVAIAPPLRFVPGAASTGRDPRPKLLVLAEHDELRPPAEVRAATAGWAAVEIEVVGGASHFFVGRTDRLTEIVLGYLEEVTTTR